MLMRYTAVYILEEKRNIVIFQKCGMVEILRLNFQEPVFLKKCDVILFGPLPFLPWAEKKFSCLWY